MKNVYLFVIKDDILLKIIKNLFDSLHLKSKILTEINYDDMYQLTDNWKFQKKGVSLTRNEVDDTFFAYIISNNFMQELITYEEFI